MIESTDLSLLRAIGDRKLGIEKIQIGLLELIRLTHEVKTQNPRVGHSALAHTGR